MYPQTQILARTGEGLSTHTHTHTSTSSLFLVGRPRQSKNTLAGFYPFFNYQLKHRFLTMFFVM